MYNIASGLPDGIQTVSERPLKSHACWDHLSTDCDCLWTSRLQPVWLWGGCRVLQTSCRHHFYVSFLFPCKHELPHSHIQSQQIENTIASLPVNHTKCQTFSRELVTAWVTDELPTVSVREAVIHLYEKLQTVLAYWVMNKYQPVHFIFPLFAFSSPRLCTP